MLFCAFLARGVVKIKHFTEIITDSIVKSPQYLYSSFSEYQNISNLGISIMLINKIPENQKKRIIAKSG